MVWGWTLWNVGRHTYFEEWPKTRWNLTIPEIVWHHESQEISEIWYNSLYVHILFFRQKWSFKVCAEIDIYCRDPEAVKIFFIQTFCDDSWFQNSLCNCHFHQFHMSCLWFWLSGEEKCSMLSITTLKNSILKGCQNFLKITKIYNYLIYSTFHP